jgi:hypothetical protein
MNLHHLTHLATPMPAIATERQKTARTITTTVYHTMLSVLTIPARGTMIIAANVTPTGMNRRGITRGVEPRSRR